MEAVCVANQKEMAAEKIVVPIEAEAVVKPPAELVEEENKEV